MRQIFEEPEIEEAERGRETEITLESTGLLLAFAGLLVVCGLCFGLGYAVGHRGSPASSVASSTGSGDQSSSTAQPSAVAEGPRAKPSAATEPPPQVADNSAATDASTPAGPDGVPVSVPDSTEAAAQTPPSANSQRAPAPLPAAQLLVRPAFPASSPQATPAIDPGRTAMPAAPTLSLMVQIAAVSHVEDANVLVNALRRRGYAVTTRRDPADNLIHVQIGPFGTRNEAESMKMKLLNDGYNAQVQQ